METIGLILGVVAGLALGVMGGGGSILTVPILVYFIGINPVLATSYSLFIVGTSSLIGALSYMKNKLVALPMVVLFGLPSMHSVYTTQKYILPSIPEQLDILGWSISKDLAIMLLFSITMIAASISMIKGRKERHRELGFIKYPLMAIYGTIVGVVAGMVGAGGGFLIVPSLVVFGRLPMKMAVGTSLSIICIQSISGFIGKYEISQGQIEWNFLLLFTAMVVLGIFIGLYCSRYISGSKLKPAFGWFVLTMGLFILSKEILKY